LAICSWLINGKLRFGELKKTACHYRADADAAVAKNGGKQNHQYELTPIGYELKTIIKQLESWGEKHKALD